MRKKLYSRQEASATLDRVRGRGKEGEEKRGKEETKYVRESNTHEAATAPDEKHLALHIRILCINHIRRRIRNRPVKQPVTGRRHTETLCADFERKQLARNNPGHGPPRTRKEENVDAHKGDGGALGRQIRGSGYGAGDGDDVLADAHADGAEEEEVAAAELLDHVEPWEGGGYVYRVGDDLGDEGVLEAGVGEILRSVVDCERVSIYTV